MASLTISLLYKDLVGVYALNHCSPRGSNHLIFVIKNLVHLIDDYIQVFIGAVLYSSLLWSHHSTQQGTLSMLLNLLKCLVKYLWFWCDGIWGQYKINKSHNSRIVKIHRSVLADPGCSGIPGFIVTFILFQFLLNQAHASRRPARAWFLKIDPVQIAGMRACVCVCVCSCPRLLITSGMI